MSLIICPECGNKIYSLARSCPRCGFILHDAIITASQNGADIATTPFFPSNKWTLAIYIGGVSGLLVGFPLALFHVYHSSAYDSNAPYTPATCAIFVFIVIASFMVSQYTLAKKAHFVLCKLVCALVYIVILTMSFTFFAYQIKK